jgi:hypothetical protein
MIYEIYGYKYDTENKTRTLVGGGESPYLKAEEKQEPESFEYESDFYVYLIRDAMELGMYRERTRIKEVLGI